MTPSELPARIEEEISAIPSRKRQEFFRALMTRWERERREVLRRGVRPDTDFNQLVFAIQRERERPVQLVVAEFETYPTAQECGSWLRKRQWENWGIFAGDKRNPWRVLGNVLTLSEEEYLEVKLTWDGRECVFDEVPTFYPDVERGY